MPGNFSNLVGPSSTWHTTHQLKAWYLQVHFAAVQMGKHLCGACCMIVGALSGSALEYISRWKCHHDGYCICLRDGSELLMRHRVNQVLNSLNDWAVRSFKKATAGCYDIFRSDTFINEKKLHVSNKLIKKKTNNTVREICREELVPVEHWVQRGVLPVVWYILNYSIVMFGLWW